MSESFNVLQRPQNSGNSSSIHGLVELIGKVQEEIGRIKMKQSEDKRIFEAAEKADFARFANLAFRINGLEKRGASKDEISAVHNSINSAIQSLRSDLNGIANKANDLRNAFDGLRYLFSGCTFNLMHGVTVQTA